MFLAKLLHDMFAELYHSRIYGLLGYYMICLRKAFVSILIDNMFAKKLLYDMFMENIYYICVYPYR